MTPDYGLFFDNHLKITIWWDRRRGVYENETAQDESKGSTFVTLNRVNVVPSLFVWHTGTTWRHHWSGLAHSDDTVTNTRFVYTPGEHGKYIADERQTVSIFNLKSALCVIYSQPRRAIKHCSCVPHGHPPTSSTSHKSLSISHLMKTTKVALVACVISNPSLKKTTNVVTLLTIWT